MKLKDMQPGDKFVLPYDGRQYEIHSFGVNNGAYVCRDDMRGAKFPGDWEVEPVEKLLTADEIEPGQVVRMRNTKALILKLKDGSRYSFPAAGFQNACCWGGHCAYEPVEIVDIEYEEVKKQRTVWEQVDQSELRVCNVVKYSEPMTVSAAGPETVGLLARSPEKFERKTTKEFTDWSTEDGVYVDITGDVFVRKDGYWHYLMTGKCEPSTAPRIKVRITNIEVSDA